MRAALAILMLATVLSAAHAFGLGEGNRFGRLGVSSKKGVVIPQPTGDILLVDGVSLILQTDAASFICRAGGC
jgi:hypothetical protein